MNETSPLLAQLIRDVKNFTRERGSRKALAEHLGVTQSAVAHYLRGASAPSAEVALCMGKWVAARKAEKKDPDLALTRSGKATRSTKPKENEQSKPSRRKP